MFICVPASTHGPRIELLYRPACHHQTLVPPGTAPPLDTMRPRAHSRVAARGAIVGVISDMTPDGGQQAQRVSSPEPVDPPSTKRLLPTAAMACEDLALGGEPETRAASSCSH